MNDIAPPEASPAPRATRPGSLRFLALVAAILFLGGVGTLCDMADDWLLHSSGVRAQSSDCKVIFSGSLRSAWTDMSVTWVTADGTTHHASESLQFYNWLRNPDQTRPCEVRYDPRWPWRYGTSWGFERLPSRIAAFLVFQAWMLVVGLWLASILARIGWRRGNRHRGR